MFDPKNVEAVLYRLRLDLITVIDEAYKVIDPADDPISRVSGSAWAENMLGRVASALGVSRASLALGLDHGQQQTADDLDRSQQLLTNFTKITDPNVKQLVLDLTRVLASRT